jgi:hypothetical protein
MGKARQFGTESALQKHTAQIITIAHQGEVYFYIKDEYIDVSVGVADAGKPIVLDAAGLIDPSMLPAADHGGLTGRDDDDHTQYLKEEASGGAASEVPDHTHQSTAECGKLDHGLSIDGLADDDHPQYFLASKMGIMGVVSDVTNSTQTPANVTGLSFAVEANKIYHFEFSLRGWSTAATCAPWFRFTGPGSPTSFWFHLDMLEVGTAYPIDREVTAFDTNTASESFQRATRSFIPIVGFLVNGANAGTVQLQFRCEDASETVTIYAGSHGIWYKLN